MDYNIQELIKPRYYGSIISLTQKEGEQLIQELKNYKLANESTDYVILHEFLSSYFPNESWDKYIERDGIKILKKDGVLKLDELQRGVVRKDSESIYHSEKIVSKVDKDELEPFVFKVPEEISKNPKLKDYYDAIYDKLHSKIIMEATVVRGEHVAINPAEFRNANRGVDILISVGREIFKEFTINTIPFISIDSIITNVDNTYAKYQKRNKTHNFK